MLAPIPTHPLHAYTLRPHTSCVVTSEPRGSTNGGYCRLKETGGLRDLATMKSSRGQAPTQGRGPECCGHRHQPARMEQMATEWGDSGKVCLLLMQT